ncbi:MAG: enoyl-CoA hydratase/isomerase family protein [Solirubrobacterales bacterium]
MTFSEEDGIGILTLDRPDAYNAMDPTMISELPVIFGWLADQADLRALVITGAGTAFCAGGDVNWFRRGVEDPDVDIVAGVRDGAETLHRGIVDLVRIPYPVIAAINGPAAGAGFSLALACDTRICSKDAFLACAYGRIGASPDGGMTYFLPRVVGPSRAVEILLNDPNLTPEAALEEKIVAEVVEPDELMERAMEKARKLGAKAPYYVKMSKRLAGTSLDHTLTEHLQQERHAIAEAMGTEDLARAVKAFFDGDEVEFEGR